jgi:NAD(P)-dependent dehydrogenase (short-subunit alcohol dehydrogenase family)
MSRICSLTLQPTRKYCEPLSPRPLITDRVGFYNFAKSALPLLLDAVDDSPYPPSLIVTGATASLKGSAKFATFAPAKFAKRALAQSLAREFGPKGVHVAHVIIDGLIDTPNTKNMDFNGGAPDGKLSPDSVSLINPGDAAQILDADLNQIAENYWHLHTQSRSTFTHELDLRPYVEKF